MGAQSATGTGPGDAFPGVKSNSDVNGRETIQGDDFAKVTVADCSPGYLDDKIVGGGGIVTSVESDDDGCQTLKLSSLNHVRHFFNADPLVHLTEEAPIANPSDWTGWYHDNTSAGKINWYYYSRAVTGPTTNLTVETINSVWLSFITPLLFSPSGDYIFINLFTRRKNDGNDETINYRSRYTYVVTDWSSVSTGSHLIYFGSDPGVRPEIDRIELVSGTGPSSPIGPQEPDEEILSVAISTSSSATSGANKFTIQEAGLSINNYNLNCTFAMP